MTSSEKLKELICDIDAMGRPKYPTPDVQDVLNSANACRALPARLEAMEELYQVALELPAILINAGREKSAAALMTYLKRIAASESEVPRQA